MIITRSWLEEFINISNISTKDICKTLNAIGLEVDSVENFDIAPKVVVGKVLDKKKHPDADKLNICQVDLGDKTIQIVCGASNVDVEQFVPVATVGCDLGNDFIIKEANLRGVESNGMICSSVELGLAKINDGIMVLDDSIGQLTLGKELRKYKRLCDDVIEIGLTPNRGDCLSIYGIARELSAFYDIDLIEQDKDINYNELSIGQLLEINSNSNLDAQLSYKAIDFTNFKLSLINRLRTAIIGKYQDNDIRNILTYATHSIGVILNAYAKEEAVKNGDLYTIDIKKDENGFDIVCGNKKLSTICVENNDINTQNGDFIIEASYVDPDLISKKVYEKKIKTGEVYYKATRGSEPNIEFGLGYFSSYISKLGALVYKGSENFINDKEKELIDVNISKVNSIIGQDIDKLKIEKILTSLSFEVKESIENVLILKVPYFRHDIKNIADITEEIVRIIGIDNIVSKPLEIDEVNRVNKTSKDLLKKNKIRFKAIENGFFETLTYVFASKENLQKYGFKTVKDELEIINPIVKELNTYRTTMLLNLVEACSNNFKIGTRSSAFFEIGTVFDENRKESKKIAFIQTGLTEVEDVSNAGKPKNIDFFTFAKKVLNGIGKFDLEPMSKILNSFVHPYQNANIFIDGKNVGYICKLHPSVCADFDLNDTFIAEVDFEAIKNDTVKTLSYSKFQSSKKDLSIIAPKSLEYKEIKKAINSLQNPNIKQYNLIDIYSDEKLGENESLTIRFVLQSDEKTLEEEDITSIMNSILDVLKQKLSIGLR